ncbi:S1 RNA-binding domain-containing protein [Roseateles paludis]|uniref:S1 RNA-binding domain-containing protein n=1 Tax=Roseateles paludis TaxID=3145238 RepID=A0ABV0FZ57_9BURK
MDSDITSLLGQYASAEPRRATGGIYAMAGFAFQARVYVAELAEALAGSGDDLRSKGDVFVEALSDIARWDGAQRLVLLQVKRTLTPATLDSAAGEIDAIESFVSTARPELKGELRYGVVSAFTSGATKWTDLPKGSLHKNLIGKLEAQGRLVSPRIELDPWWRAVTAVWHHVADPYSFARFAFERVMLRRVDPDDARLCRDAIAERYAVSRRPGSHVGQLLSAADFAPARQVHRFRLEVGRQATLARMRAGQYMPRDARVALLTQRAAELSELAVLSPDAAIRVLWLSGRSGVGKSVLLLQLLEQLVLSGRRVQWLSGDASLLDRALRDTEDLRPHEAPEFIAVDDIYDRDAREQLDFSRLASYVDEQGPRGWPVLVTCGPTEFAEAFVDATRFRGFEVTAVPINPVGSSEAADVLHWVSERRGSAASGQGVAFAQSQQGQGLFVSMAAELEFGDLREFGAKFCDRLAAASLQQPLRPLLALNRLYLRAPYRWLEESDRESLEALNRDGDFSVLELQAASQLVRLTHPHLSDAIYRALVKPSTPLAYARDLALAFERAVDEGDDTLAARLLRTFSASDRSLLVDRLVDVDMDGLAARCVAKWRILPPGGDRRIQSDMAISWACWRAAHASLGTGANDLIQRALETMDQWRDSDPRQAYWPAFWWRLWRSHPNDHSLADWARRRIVSDEGLKIGQWSRIWEALAEHQSGTNGVEPEMADVAARWLESNQERADWHFVWKKLPRQGQSALEMSRRLALAELELTDVPCWAFVLQDMLALAGSSVHEDEARNLVAQGCSWLTGREDRAEWTYVWRALLERPKLLPETVDERALVAQGCSWLTGREDRAEWTYVWRALLERPKLLPETVDERALVAQGCSWLTGREDRAEWTYVWRALLERPKLLPETVDERALVAQGCSWLTGREDRAEWAYVWRALLERPKLLPETVDERALVTQGCSWLASREDRAEWTYVWRALLERPKLLPETVDERALVAQGRSWLTGREDRAEWTYVWRALLERPKLLPETVDERALVAQGCSWLTGREDRSDWLPVFQVVLKRRSHLPAGNALGLSDQAMKLLARLGDFSRGEAGHLLESMMDAGLADDEVVDAALDWLQADRSHPAWPLIAGKCLRRVRDDERARAISKDLVQAIERHPNAGAWYRLQTILESEDSASASESLGTVKTALAQRKSAPAWAEVARKLQSGEPIKATVTKQIRQDVTVELQGGLFALLRVEEGFRHRQGRDLEVVVTMIMTHLDRIVVLPYRETAVPTPLEDLVPGANYEGTVTGHQRYGIFIDVRGQKGLVHAKHLGDVASYSDRFPMGTKVQVRLVEVGPKGLVLALPLRP